MSNHIIIKDLEIECIIGIHDWERKTPQSIYIDIQGYLDFSRVIASHAFKDTIDYVSISKRVTEIAQKGRFKLLEALADDISTKLFAEFPLTSLAMEFKKPSPDVPQAKYVGINFKINKSSPILSRSYKLDDRNYVTSKTLATKPLAGKVALITGAAQGLGRALAENLGRQGANIAVHYRESKKAATDFVAELSKNDISAKTFQGELGNFEAMKNLTAAVIKEFKKIDFLINNVGAYSPKGLWDFKPEEFAQIINTNICGTYYLTREVVSHMREQKFGRIINIGQAAAERIRAHKNETPYHLSKTAILTLTKSIAALEAKNGITCNVVSPGIMVNNTYSPPGIFDAVPMGRLGQFEDFFGAVEFLLSPAADYITGTTIEVTGGYGL